MSSNHRILAILLGAAILGGFATTTLAQANFESDLQILERLAEERYAEGDLEKSADLYQEIAQKQTDVRQGAKALFTAAWLLELADNQPRSLEVLTRSLRIDPEQGFDAALYNRDFELMYEQALDIAQRERQQEAAKKTQSAVGAMKAGRDQDARSLLEQALELNPNNPVALYNLALIDLRAEATPQTLSDFERVVSLSYQTPGPEMTKLRAKALASIGVIYSRDGRTDDAEQAFLEATRADPLEAAAWRNLGLLYRDQGRYETATTLLERAHELLPDDRQVTLALASSLESSGRAGQAAASLKTDLQRRPDDAEMWMRLGTIEQGRGRTGEAVYALERGMSADGENRTGVGADAALQLATLHLQQEEIEAALTVANQAVAWDRSDASAWSVLGHAQLAAEQMAPATASLGRAAELDPESVERQVALGHALVAAKQLPRAEAVFLRALTLDPNSTEASTNLESVRSLIANERAIVAGKARPRKPIAPKKIGLDFAGIDYKDLQLRGALVKQVSKKSPAARAGLRKGDLILWIGDYAVLSGKDFFGFLKRSPPGDSLDLEYLRDGRIHDVEILLR